MCTIEKYAIQDEIIIHTGGVSHVNSIIEIAKAEVIS